MNWQDRMVQDLELGGYAKDTITRYAKSVSNFSRFHQRSPEKLGQKEVRAWVEHLRQQPIGSQRLRLHFAALKFLYGKTLAKPEVVAFLSWPNDVDHLPVVLSAAEVNAVL